MFELLQRHFVEKPWGQVNLPSEFGAPLGTIGEVWYDRPAFPLPLLCKWLFAGEKLSIQVHPSDAQAKAFGQPSGKEECWIVTGTQGDARLGIGLTETLSRSELHDAVQSGEIEQALDWKPVKPGDWFHIPAGTIHAIGAGVQLVEIQQNADITYRLYDYGRPRDLHIVRGVLCSRPDVYRGPFGSLLPLRGIQRFGEKSFFPMVSVVGDPAPRCFDSQSIIIPVKGAFVVDGSRITAGQVGHGRPEHVEAESPCSAMIIARYR